MHEYGPGAIGISARVPRLCHYSVIVHIQRLYPVTKYYIGVRVPVECQPAMNDAVECADIKKFKYKLSQKLIKFLNL